MDSPFITVILPVRNESQFIEQTIRSIAGQDYPRDRLEILVVDGMSDDDTVAVVERLAKSVDALRLHRNPARLASSARNIGVRQARGDILLFVDGHVHIDNDQLLKNTARLMNDKGVSVLSRPQFLETPDNTLLQRAIALARRSWLGHGLDSTIYLDREDYVNPTSSGAAYRREVFDAVGLFDESFDATEDYEFNYRVHLAGYRSFSSPVLSVFYYPRSNLRGLFRQMYRYGLGRFRLARKHRPTLRASTLAPALLTLCLAMAPLALLTGFARIPVALVGLVYAAFVAGTSLFIAAAFGMRYLTRLLVIFPTIHLGLGTGFLAGVVEVALGGRAKSSKAKR